jgi:hypothetical protein
LPASAKGSLRKEKGRSNGSFIDYRPASKCAAAGQNGVIG